MKKWTDRYSFWNAAVLRALTGQPHIPVCEIGNAGEQLGNCRQDQQGPDRDHGGDGSGQDGAGEVDDHAPGVVGACDLHGHRQPQKGGGGIVHQCPPKEGHSEQDQEESLTAQEHHRKQQKGEAAHQGDDSG